MIYSPDPSKGLEVNVDANFVGGWDPKNSLDANTLYSCNGFITRYASFPVLWKSKLQADIALSTAEAVKL